MKNKLTGIGTVLILLSGSGIAQANLTTIGTALYDDGTGAASYNLIWDNDNNGNSVVWLDYSNSAGTWEDQTTWAAGLGSSLIYSIDSEYTVNWTDTNWRLPGVGQGPDRDYNQVTSELGHLYYDEFGNQGKYDELGNFQSGYGLANTGDFSHLTGWFYWQNDEYSVDTAWDFNLEDGYLDTYGKLNTDDYGIALRNANVAVNPVPEPTTMLLFGTGLISMVGSRLRRRKK